MATAPVQVERTSVIKLDGNLERVFPLFGPLREREWAAGWDPVVIWPADEALQERMVFLVRHGDGRTRETVWVVSKYDEQQAIIEYAVFAEERVRWILIRCRPGDDGASTMAEITYTYVGTSESAQLRNQHDVEVMYRHDLSDWERAINHYLRTGSCLSHH